MRTYGELVNLPTACFPSFFPNKPSLHGMRSEIKCAFNVMQVKLLSSCSRRLQLHKVNESNDVYKNMWSCCSKWDDDYGKIREHDKCKTAVIRLHQRTDSHLSHEGGFSLLAAIAAFSPVVRQNGGFDFAARLDGCCTVEIAQVLTSRKQIQIM